MYTLQNFKSERTIVTTMHISLQVKSLKEKLLPGLSRYIPDTTINFTQNSREPGNVSTRQTQLW